MPNPSKSTVYAFRNDRMGSRLIAILNAIRFAQKYDLPWKIFWLVTDNVSEEIKHPELIFSESLIADHFVSQPDFEAIENAAYEVSFKNPGWESPKLQSEFEKGRDFVFSHSFPGIAMFPDEDEASVRASLPAAFDALSFSPLIEEMMRKIRDTLGSEPPVAYHIRRGDIIDTESQASRKLWPTKYTPREYYEIHLANHAKTSGGKILVFSDEPKEVGKMRQQSDLVLSVDHIIDASQMTPAAFDFLSLYAMSLCTAIIGPPGSGFSETAALIGNAKVTDVTQAISEKDQARAMENLSRKLDEGPQHFLGIGDIGQSLHFAAQHWKATGETVKGAAIVQKYIDQGLNAAYVYVILCELYLEHGDHKAALAVRDTAGQQKDMYDIAMAQLNLLCVRAHVLAGDLEKACQSYAISIWTFPNIQNGQSTGLAMLLERQLNSENFFPFDNSLRRLALPGSPATGGDASGGDTTKKQRPIIVPVFSMDILTRDWTDFLGKRRHRLFHDKDRIVMLRNQALGLTGQLSPKPSIESVLGLYALELGDPNGARRRHEKALKEQPENALFRKRYADVFVALDKPKRAIKELRKITDAGPCHVLYWSCLAELLLKNKGVDEAIEIYQKILPKSGSYPEIILNGAKALSRRPKEFAQQAIKYARMAVDMSQGSSRVYNAYITVLSKCEANTELLKALDTIEEFQTLRPKFKKMQNKLRKTS